MIHIGRALVVGSGAFGGLALLLAVAGCGNEAAPHERAAFTQSAIGEPNSGFPSPVERLGIMAINRARSDPATVKGPQSTVYPARPPVLWNYALSRAARFQATSLLSSGIGLQHESPCALKTDVASSGCTGEVSCACATPVPTSCNCDSCTPTGTAPFTRIAYFTAGSGVNATGEVAAAGYPEPFAVVDGWMNEAANADGHRRNLTDQGISSNVMGYGHSSGGGGCYQTFDFSDSGMLAGATIPKIPTAAVRPPSGAAGNFTFYATWADPALGAPASLNAVIDGVCKPMAREFGSDTLNATYKVSATLAAGCHNYYILGVDSGASSRVYPTTGALTISVGSGTCSADYLSSAPDPSCSTIGGGGAGGASGAGGALSSGGTGSGGKSGAGGTANGGGGGKSGAGGNSGGGGKSGAGGNSGGATGGGGNSGGATGGGATNGGNSNGGVSAGGGAASGGSMSVSGSFGDSLPSSVAGGGSSGASGAMGLSGSNGVAGDAGASAGAANFGGASHVAGGSSTAMGGAIVAGGSPGGASADGGSDPSPSGCSCSLEANRSSTAPFWSLGLLAVIGVRARRRSRCRVPATRRQRASSTQR